MFKEIEKAITTYKKEIIKLEKSDLTKPENITKAIQKSRNCLQQLRVLVRDRKFSSIENEITFFKEQKPYVFGCLKFFVSIYKANSEKPKRKLKEQRKYGSSTICGD